MQTLAEVRGARRSPTSRGCPTGDREGPRAAEQGFCLWGTPVSSSGPCPRASTAGAARVRSGGGWGDGRGREGGIGIPPVRDVRSRREGARGQPKAPYSAPAASSPAAPAAPAPRSPGAPGTSAAKAPGLDTPRGGLPRRGPRGSTPDLPQPSAGVKRAPPTFPSPPQSPLLLEAAEQAVPAGERREAGGGRRRRLPVRTPTRI